ncbi:MAG: hypothetical protein K6T83_19430 [Alicyclobacillus sp.]|nr:hypothetical protein [Alicyclobacillus sp.]
MNAQTVNRDLYFRRAEALKPKVFMEKQTPLPHNMMIVENRESFFGFQCVPSEMSWFEKPLKCGDAVILDFGETMVGTLTLRFECFDGRVDAPARLRVRLGEVPHELARSVDDYHGWLSAGWIQEEWVTIDNFPREVTFERRFSFRYVKVEVVGISQRYCIRLADAVCVRQSSLRPGAAAACPPLVAADSFYQEIDEVCARTLRNCMQLVYEDGPKRDRRLWIGDLRLQALASYALLHGGSLVARCLYLIAACSDPHTGAVPSAVYVTPEPGVGDDLFLFDYSMMFTIAVYDYYKTTQDARLVTELWPVIWNHIHIKTRKNQWSEWGAGGRIGSEHTYGARCSG